MNSEMRRDLDDHTADRLLSGRIAATDAPPGYEHVARLARAARQPAVASELANETSVVALVAAAVGAEEMPQTARKTMLSRVLTAKVAAIAAVSFIGAGTAAAATNNLPDPAQTAVANAAERVGLDVPKPDKADASERGKGPDANGPAGKGLCVAASSGSENGRTHKSDSVAFRNLAQAAADAGKSVDEFCADVTATTTTTVTTTEGGEEGSTNNSGGDNSTKRRNDDRGGPPSTAGKSADHAPVPTPNRGQGNPAAPPANSEGQSNSDAAGENDDFGRNTAEERSGGRSNRSQAPAD